MAQLLFLIYVNSLCNFDINGDLISFADDTAIVFEGNTWNEVFEVANTEMARVKQHLDHILLSLNIGKTNFMCFSASQRSAPDHHHSHPLKIHSCDQQDCNCPSIRRVDTVRYLGIILDSHLRWDAHISYLVNKIRKTIYIFREISNILDRQCVLMAYYSLVQSLLSYGSLGWGGACRTYIDRLIKVQKIILRIIFHRPRLYPSITLYREAGVLDVRQLYIKTTILHFRAHIRQAQTRAHDYRTRHASLILHPRMRKKFGHRHFIFLAPKFFNSLPEEIKSTNPFSKFKKSVHNWIKETGNEGSEELFHIQV